MNYVSVAELKAKLSHYLGVVREGKAIYVTSHHKPVAQLQPIPEHGDLAGMIPPDTPMKSLRDVQGISLASKVDVLAILSADRAKR